MLDLMDNTERPSRGGLPSIVQHFEIEGLYGFRSISLRSEYAATILIAKNGSGKTTILAMLDAFLKGEFSRLREVQFSKLRCKLRDVPAEVELTHEQVLSYAEIRAGSDIERAARRYEIEPDALFKFVEAKGHLYEGSPYDSPVFTKLLEKLNYNRTEIRKLSERLATTLAADHPDILNAQFALRSALSDIEIVYLPTYRRIELSMDKSLRTDRFGRPRKVIQASAHGLHPGNIQFGLQDILDKLDELNTSIVSASNLGYRKISADIIKELLDGTFDAVTLTGADIPSQEELDLFFARLKENERHYMGPFETLSLPNIERIYTGSNISDQSNKFLRYFLAKLDTVIQSTREIELLVSRFIDNCNNYLSSFDPSASVSDASDREAVASTEDKQLRLSRRDLRAFVESLYVQRPIPLDALSSGEKQMISIFARLYLYPPKRKIILIDEPELSLSIEWQRNILEDVMAAPLCAQVVAITHSPFVFDNSLEPFARSLKTSIEFTEPELPLPHGQQPDD